MAKLNKKIVLDERNKLRTSTINKIRDAILL